MALRIFLFLFLIVPFTALAVIPSSALVLSDTLHIDGLSKLGAHVNMLPNYHGFLAEGVYKNQKYSIWISRRDPDMIANSFSVARYWKENLAFTKSIGDSYEDKGCHELASHAFRCDRTAVGKSKRQAAESIFWNSKSDLVVIRVSADKLDLAKEVLSKLEFKVDAKVAKK